MRQVAAGIEADTALISKIERGERIASKQQVIKIANFLNVKEEELLALWMADKLESIMVEEPEVAYKALRIADKNRKNEKRYKTH